ncbi:MAG: HYR domain-containing protein, partial [Planctomycetota bacterium]
MQCFRSFSPLECRRRAELADAQRRDERGSAFERSGYHQHQQQSSAHRRVPGEYPPDPGQLTAVVTWTDPTATDACDGPGIPVTCSPPSGSTFSPGTTTVTCTATDSCGRTDSCSFSVTVVPPTLTFDMELSPTVSTGTLQRCVTFELWDCDAVGGP